MKKRKKYIIDKKFQRKITFSVIGLTAVVVAIIISLISYNIMDNNEKLSNIIIIQKQVVEAMLTYSQEGRTRGEKIVINNIYKNHDKNITAMENIIDMNFKFLILIIAFTVIQCFVLYFIIIRKTHRISGPIYVMSNYLKDIINGKHPRVRPLRKGDELQGFHDLLAKMIDTLKDKD